MTHKYWLGDPCYILSKEDYDLYMIAGRKVSNVSACGKVGFAVISLREGVKIVDFPLGGDMPQIDSEGRVYGIDSGAIILIDRGYKPRITHAKRGRHVLVHPLAFDIDIIEEGRFTREHWLSDRDKICIETLEVRELISVPDPAGGACRIL